MSYNSKYTYRKRTFLNTDPHFRAYIIASVERREQYPEIILEIADCSRQINLEFSIGTTKKELKDVSKKIKLFRKIINDFADAVETEIKYKKQNM